MIGILDLVSAGVIVGSALVIAIKLRSELKSKELSPRNNWSKSDLTGTPISSLCIFVFLSQKALFFELTDYSLRLKFLWV